MFLETNIPFYKLNNKVFFHFVTKYSYKYILNKVKIFDIIR